MLRRKMSGGCSRFKQNAWKKEMCSNCYKTKDEHHERPRTSLPLPSLAPPSQGILKGWDRDRKKKRKSVSFPMDECEIIGYGGEEVSSEEEDFLLEDDLEDTRVGSRRDETDDEEDAVALKDLTKSNTDFNSVLNNLSGTGVQTSPPLRLGIQKREPIHITVQPFVDDSRKIQLDKLLRETAATPLSEKKEERPNHREVETRKVNITRGSVITKNHESVKNKLYIQNILNNKNEKRNSYISEKVYISTEGGSKVTDDEKDENVDYMNSKNRIVLNCSTVSLSGADKLLESREMAGEPDGKADSDEAEVPVTPPPRISFLHRESPGVRRVTETFENKRITTIETMHEVKRTVESVEPRVRVRRLSISETEEKRVECSPKKDSVELASPARRRISEGSNGLLIEPASRRLSDSTDDRRKSELIDVKYDLSPSKKSVEILDERIPVAQSRKNSSAEDANRCVKRQAPQPPNNESESETECCEVQVRSSEAFETAASPVETLRISVSSEESTGSAVSSPEPMDDGQVSVSSNSPKREPPPPPPVGPERSKSPPEPMPRHNRTTFSSDVEKKKMKMKETIRKLLRFGTKDEAGVEPVIQSPRVRPQIIHPLDLNKSAVQVLPTAADILRSETPTTPTTPNAVPVIGRPTKPPPPPRSESLNLMERLKTKPTGAETSNIYANLGEARSGIAPTKPTRSGSVRETGGVVKLSAPASDVLSKEEMQATADMGRCTEQQSTDLYEAIGSANSAPECDMAHYYGSETESDTYSPTFNRLQEGGVVGGVAGRRGSSVVPYISNEENLAALSQLNLQAINHLLAKVLERDKSVGGSLNGYRLETDHHKELCWTVFCSADRLHGADGFIEQRNSRVMLAVSRSDSTLLLPRAYPPLARFTDSIPSQLLPSNSPTSISEVTVLPWSEVQCLSGDPGTDLAWSLDTQEDRSVQHKLLVLLQVLELIGRIHDRRCSLDNFLLLRHSDQPVSSVSYVQQSGGEDKQEDWKACVGRLCEGYRVSESLRQRLAACQSDTEAAHAVSAWLYGPPPDLPRQSLHAWLAMQRAYALRCYLAKPDLSSLQHVAFLASDPDPNKLFEESLRLHRPSHLLQRPT